MGTNDNWNFNESFLWANKYPECGMQEQTPINIDTSDLTECKLLCQVEHKIKPAKCRINYDVNNRITLEYPHGSFIKFNNFYYNLRNISIHVPSLHTIDNERFDMEVFMIYKSDQSGSSTSNDNGIIVSRLFNRMGLEYGDGQDFISGFINRIPKNPIDYYKVVEVSPEWTADLLIPKDKTSFFLYPGSLPYPPCNERYTVLVYEKAENISDTNYELLKQNVGENYRPIQNRNARKIFYNSGKQVSMEDTFKKDTVSSDRFLKCFQVDPVPTTPAVTTKSSLPDRRLSYRTVNRVSSFFMLIVMVFLLILAFYFTKFLYKKFYVQRVLRALVPSDLVARTPRWTAWKECSKTSAAVSLVEKGQKAAPGTPGAPGAPRTLGASGTPTTRTQAIPTATAYTKPQIAPVAASTSTKPHIASAPAAVPARPAPVAPQRHVASAP